MLCFISFQLLDVDPQDTEEDGAVVDLDAQRKGKCAVIKTSTRQVCSENESTENLTFECSRKCLS